MTSIPHKFFIKNFERETDIKLPPLGQYAVGNLFFKPDEETLHESKRQLEEIAESLGLRVLGWREPPKDSTLLGPAAASREPIILQPFVVLASAYGYGNSPETQILSVLMRNTSRDNFTCSESVRPIPLALHNWFYLCSLSNKNIVYKGQLAPVQVYQYYYDSGKRRLRSPFCSCTLPFLHKHFPFLGSCPTPAVGRSQWYGACKSPVPENSLTNN
jgi:glutamate synthase (NADPH/NADH)